MHAGHCHLIETALRESDEVSVILCDKPDQNPDGARRLSWLRELFPAATILRTPDDLPEAPQPWADRTLHLLSAPPTTVFSSEHYGDTYAALLGAKHRMVDLDRSSFPVSGTAVREDPIVHWEFLPAPVREHYAFRVVVIGAESTGKTTLCQELGEALNAPWVPECGREYTETLYQGTLEHAGIGEGHLWQSGDFITIAKEQSRREDVAARKSQGIVIADTNAWATGLWHERYLGKRCQELDTLGAACRVSLYLHTAPDLPFVQDGLRDGEAIRGWMDQRFTETLPAGVPVARIQGTGNHRLKAAMNAIQTEWSRTTKAPFPG